MIRSVCGVPLRLGLLTAALAPIIGGSIAAAGAIGGSALGSSASSSAANTQASAANNATAAELNMFNQTQQNLQPYMNAGTNSLNALQQFLGIGGNPQASDYGAGVNGFQYNPANDPEYNFLLQQGSSAITNQASALGGVNSGATLKALSDYGQQTALQSYQNEFNNWNTTLNNVFQRLTGVTQLGQTSAAGVGNAALTTGAQVGSNIIGAGNAQAAGQIGSANSISSGLQSIFNSPQFAQLFNGNSNGASGLVGGVNALTAANQSSDPIAALNASQGWTGQ
jgi:hypothetical protein